jgi:hypothetical protein
VLANFAIALVRKLLGAGHAGFSRSWTASQTAEGLLPSAPLQFQKIFPWKVPFLNAADLWCGDCQMLSEFQLWALSTAVIVALVVFA